MRWSITCSLKLSAIRGDLKAHDSVELSKGEHAKSIVLEEQHHPTLHDVPGDNIPENLSKEFFSRRFNGHLKPQGSGTR